MHMCICHTVRVVAFGLLVMWMSVCSVLKIYIIFTYFLAKLFRAVVTSFSSN